MGDEPSFRRVAATDIETLLPLLRAYWDYDGIDYRDADVRRGLQELVDHPELGAAWLVELEARPVGYFILSWGFDLEFGGRHGWLTDLFLVPERRGQGLGRAVFRFVDQQLAAAGASCVELMVERDNQEAMAFYRKLGFAPADRVPMARWLVEPDDSA